MDQENLEEMFRDLLWLNAVIATELIQITENTSSILRQSPPPDRCITEHQALRMHALEIVRKYGGNRSLENHLTGHS